jgi:hypothetical protein
MVISKAAIASETQLKTLGRPRPKIIGDLQRLLSLLKCLQPNNVRLNYAARFVFLLVVMFCHG